VANRPLLKSHHPNVAHKKVFASSFSNTSGSTSGTVVGVWVCSGVTSVGATVGCGALVGSQFSKNSHSLS